MSNKTASSSITGNDALDTAALAESLGAAETAEEPRTPEIAANAQSLLNAAKLKGAMATVRDKASLALTTVAFAGALAGAPNALGAEIKSPYGEVAASGKTELALKEEPSQNADIKTIMERYKQGAEFEKIAAMPAEQRRKLMEYYKKGKAAGVKDRLLAGGMGGIVRGYGDIAEVRLFIEEYQKTGKKRNTLPLPYLNFSNAAEKFPEAGVMFASELDITKKMEVQIKSILESIAADADKRAADADKRAAENRQATAENRQATAENRKQIEALDRILKLLK
jgi:hypothetical protein